MIIKKKENLAKYTTFRIGGETETLYIPEHRDELIHLVKKLKKDNIDFYLLGNGSNVLMEDQKIIKPVILNTKMDLTIKQKNDGTIYMGSSVDLRKMVMYCAQNNMDPHAGLITIPGTIGGAIVMNAGRRSFDSFISNYLVSVDVFDGNHVFTVNKQDCNFSFRNSIFKSNTDWLILGATFNIPYMDKETALNEVRRSMDSVREKSYMKHHSAGSVFLKKTGIIIRLLRGVRIGNAEYSKTTLNTIHNLGNAKFNHVLWLIRLAKFLHTICLRKCELEVKILK